MLLVLYVTAQLASLCWTLHELGIAFSRALLCSRSYDLKLLRQAPYDARLAAILLFVAMSQAVAVLAVL